MRVKDIIFKGVEKLNKKETIWSAAFINLFILYSVMNMSQQMMNTLIPLYVKFLGATATIVGTVSSVFAITALAVRPVASPAFDSFSKKKLMFFAMIIITVSFVGYSLAKTIPVLIAARLLHGVGMGFLGPLCLALASESLPDNKLGSGIAIFSLGHALAQGVGPSAGLKLSDLFGYNNTFLICTAIMGASCILALTLKEKQQIREKYVISWDRIVAKEAIKPSVIMFFLSTSYACVHSFIAIYGKDLRGINDIGLYFTVNAVTLLVTRPFIGKAADKFGFDKVLIPGMVCFVLSFVLIYMADSLEMFIAAGILGALGFGSCNPIIQALSMKSVPKERRGAGGNTNYIGMDLGMLLGPLLAGFIIDRAIAASMSKGDAYALTFLLMAIPATFALGYFIINKKKILADSVKYEYKNEEAEAAEAEINEA